MLVVKEFDAKLHVLQIHYMKATRRRAKISTIYLGALNMNSATFYTYVKGNRFPDDKLETLLDEFQVDTTKIGVFRFAEITAQELDDAMMVRSPEIVTRTDAIDKEIAYFTAEIAEKLDGFVGRRFVLDAFEAFRKENDRGYFVLWAYPGVGKSAIAARIAHDHLDEALVHFNNRISGPSKPDRFLRNICAQLVSQHHLPYSELPPNAGVDGEVVNRLLNEAAAKLTADGKPRRILLVVDALDEVDMNQASAGANVLYLPKTLPKGVYVFATARRETLTDRPLRFQCPQQPFLLDDRSQDNQADIREYLAEEAKKQPVREYYVRHRVADRHMTHLEFVEEMTGKSEGNFMYIRCVVAEILAGRLRDRNIKSLPQGLRGYYLDHWLLMAKENQWQEVKRPLLASMCVSSNPIAIPALAGMLDSFKITEAEIRDALEGWSQFLRVTLVPVGTGEELAEGYAFYHSSLRDFMMEHDNLKQFDYLRDASRRAIDYLVKQGFPVPAPIVDA
jgi:hypothetical protein